MRTTGKISHESDRDILITIRRIKTGETDLFRQIRLASLKDAPYAFSSTYHSAVRRSAESWREQVDRTAQGGNRGTFIALSDDTPIGIGALYRLEDQTEVGEVLQVWVSPDFRGTRVAWNLMDIIFIWAGENHFHKIIAGIKKGNTRALRFYTKYGFTRIEESARNKLEGLYLVKEVKPGK